MKIILDYPVWIYLVCILVGVVFSFLLYRKQSLFKTSKLLFWTLVFLRFCLGSILTLLLFNPLLQYNKRIEEKPKVAFLIDNSSSIISGKDSSFIRGEFQQKIQSLIQDVDDKYDAKQFIFGETTRQSDSLNFTDKQTNLSEVLTHISDQYYNQNLAAVVLISDGIYNEGTNPDYLKEIPNTSLFTIALGDTSKKKDLILREVTHNKITFLDNKFPVKVSINASKLGGKISLISIKHKGEEIASKEFTIDDDNFFVEENFLIDATSVGIQKYEVELKSINEEYTTLNNSKTIYVEVLNSKQKILLLANAPHPDVSAIRSAIETNKNYVVEYKTIDEFKASPNLFDAIILHNLPSGKHLEKIKNIVSSQTPTLFILGEQTNYNQLASLDVGVGIDSPKSFAEYSPKLNTNFSLFELSPENESFFMELSPLKSPFSSRYNISKQNVLAYQKVGAVSTQNPLIGFNEYNRKKSGYVLGEGLWRWKLLDFKKHQHHNNFNAFILKSIQYLSSKEDKRFFRAFTDKTLFTENERLIIHAELYNKSYELVNNPEVELELENENKDKFTYVFSKQNNRYFLEFNGLNPGNYIYTATTKFNNEEYVVSGAFSVSELKNELINTVANHQLLKQLSNKTNGQLFSPFELDKLKSIFESDERFPSVTYMQSKSDSIINLRWIFILIVALVSLEWFIRKREGGY